VAYCTVDDLEKKLDRQRLIELTDTVNNPPATVDEAVAARAIAEADALIDSHAAKRHPTPLDPVPEAIRGISATLAVFHLHRYRNLNSELWRKSYEDAVEWLRALAAGRVELSSGPTPPPEKGGTGITMTAAERVFTRDKLKGW